MNKLWKCRKIVPFQQLHQPLIKTCLRVIKTKGLFKSLPHIYGYLKRLHTSKYANELVFIYKLLYQKYRLTKV